MPELPEVETVCRGLRGVLEGRSFARIEARRPDLRRPLPVDLAGRATGLRIDAVDRRAKYILVRLADGAVLLMHLGMSGRILVSDGPPNAIGAHDHVIFTTDAGHVLRFQDPRRFGAIDLIAAGDLADHPLLAHLGPEPLDDAFDQAALAQALAGRRSPVKAVLLDQTRVVGIGNIYVCEALYQAGIDPRRIAAEVTPAESARLVAAIKAVLIRAIAAGGSSLRDHRQPSGELGYFQHEWAVYGRTGQPCPDCDCADGIQRLTQSNRSTFYCAQRQR